MQKIEDCHADRRLTIDELYQQCPEESCSPWLREQAGEFCATGIKKPDPRLTKCIAIHGDYVEIK
jgi:hypothetical protein